MDYNRLLYPSSPIDEFRRQSNLDDVYAAAKLKYRPSVQEEVEQLTSERVNNRLPRSGDLVRTPDQWRAYYGEVVPQMRAVRAEQQQFDATRTPVNRLLSADAFAVSAPIRMLTGGKYGASNLLEILPAYQGLAPAFAKGEADFARANEGSLETAAQAGESAMALPGLQELGVVEGGIAGTLKAMRNTRTANALNRLLPTVDDASRTMNTFAGPKAASEIVDLKYHKENPQNGLLPMDQTQRNALAIEGALPGFHNPVLKAILEMKQNTGTGEQFLNSVINSPGVSKSSLEYSGIGNYLSATERHTKDELLAYAKKNTPIIQEEILGESPYTETKFSDRQVFNSGKYREFLFKYPGIEDTYSSPHFKKNEIAHMRTTDLIGPNNEKVLFINEVQSDLHQKGRAEGYGTANGVPDAPFKGDKWLDLSLKRALQYAADNGYDAISWANSQQIASVVGGDAKTLEPLYDNKIPKFFKRFAKEHGGKAIDKIPFYGQQIDPLDIRAISAGYKSFDDMAKQLFEFNEYDSRYYGYDNPEKKAWDDHVAELQTDITGSEYTAKTMFLNDSMKNAIKKGLPIGAAVLTAPSLYNNVSPHQGD